MNLSLLDPFILAQDCPEVIIGALEEVITSLPDVYVCRLPSGQIGPEIDKSDGTVVIFDVETNGVARKLRGHTRQVQSLSWSSDGRYILSASQDWRCILWDLNDGSRIRTIRFDAAVFVAEIHPENHLLFVAALFQDRPVMVDMSSNVPVKNVLPSCPKRTEMEREALTKRQLANDACEDTTVICWTISGSHILAGTNRGWINIIDSSTMQIVHSVRHASGILTSIRLTASGRKFLTNCSDRIIRTAFLPDLDDPKLDWENMRIEPEHKFQDIVNRLAWNNVTISPTGEYVIASIYMNQDLYIWETNHGSLQKILEARPKMEMSSVEWHPHKPYIAATGLESGKVFLWSVTAPQRWSALAPDFQEVDENIDYVEREDEFDIHPIEEVHKRMLKEEDEDVDVLTIEPDKYQNTGDFRMPVVYDLYDSDSDDELLAIGAGQFRRKSPGQGKDWATALEDGSAV